MENRSEQPSKKSLAMWGIPIVILVGLIIALIMELTGDEEVAFEPPKKKEEVVIQTTDEDTDSVRIDVRPILETQPEETTTQEAIETPIEADEEPKLAADPEGDEPQPAEADEEAEKSYIVEEGDSLWKIAKRKDLLGDPFKWKTILIQNRGKINYTIFSEETGQWKVMVDAGKRLVFKPRETTTAKTSFDRTRKKRYAVQLMSLNTDQLDIGVDIVKFLIKDGYHAYLYRTRDKIKTPNLEDAQYFYRIRVGFFETEREALSVGEEIVFEYEDKNIFPPDFWAVLPSYRELNGELIDFGVQRNKPWIIQLTEQNNRKQAIEDLKDLASFVDFSYISQKKDPEDGYQYRTRVGFYETRAEAEKVLSKVQASMPERYLNARIMEIRHVMEDAIGQSTGQSSLKKIQ